MSSICGICRPDGPAIESSEIAAMVHALDYWNAESRGTWTTDHAALGHLLLPTTAQSLRETLPARDEAAGVAITGDCRLDNRTDLAKRLGLDAGGLAGLTDERLVLHAYLRWSEQCVTHLLGDFAFVIWDGRRRLMFCARDPFGVKPFYYYAQGGLLAFASEMKGLLALPYVDRTVNETWIGDYLHHLSLDRVTTFYAHIKRLEAAHSLTFANGVLRMRRYWAIDPHHEVRLPSESDYVEAARDKLALAIRRRVDTPFEVGAELSGGLDSAAITTLAQQHLSSQGRDLQTFSQVLPEGALDRPGYPPDARWAIDLVCRDAGITRTCFLSGDDGVLPALEWAMRYYDEPPRTLVSLDNHDLYEAAAERGVRVLLSGFGGNFAVSAAGRGRLRELFWRGQWIEFHKEVSAIERQPLDRLVAAVRPVLGWFVGPVFHLLMQKGIWQLHRTRPTRRAFARRLGMFERTFRHSRRYSARGSLRQMVVQLLDVALALRLEAAHIPVTARKIEHRYPLLDAELVAWFTALPSHLKFWRGVDRYLFRQCLNGLVPDEVRLYAGPRASGNPGQPIRRERDGAAIEAMIGSIAANDPVLAYLDLQKLAAEPRIRGRRPRPRYLENMMALILTEKLRQARATGSGSSE